MWSGQAALRYEEPGIVTMLILTSFLLLLNTVNYALDKILYCGLVGQIFIGIAFGTPGGNWLSRDVQEAVMQLGYLGLILIVYEGGLSTDLRSLRANLVLSGTVALIGISAPVGLSFLLLRLLDVTPLQAFAAGAALCSTSLGTTFTVLTTSGLTESRLGAVLSSAAMMDDVVGLVMVQVISTLGSGVSDFRAATIVRPIGVSLAFAVILPLLCRTVVAPLTRSYHANVNQRSIHGKLATAKAMLIAHTMVLVALVTGASYAGTSNLFTAYLAGAATTWWDDRCKVEVAKCMFGMSTTKGSIPISPSRSPDGVQLNQRGTSHSDTAEEHRQPSTVGTQSSSDPSSSLSGRAVFEKYYSAPLATILKPFFFASLGFSIPVTKMFAAEVVWRGLVYTALMVLGKMLCGLCLIRFRARSTTIPKLGNAFPMKVPFKTTTNKQSTKSKKATTAKSSVSHAVASDTIEPASRTTATPAADTTTSTGSKIESVHSTSPSKPSSSGTTLPKPLSLYPAAILGMAMVARGEIGLLIASLAESDGVFTAASNGETSELFMIVVWAILLCTILGPVSVGLLVKRVRRLQAMERSVKTGRGDPLGIWGIMSTSYGSV